MKIVLALILLFFSNVLFVKAQGTSVQAADAQTCTTTSDCYTACTGWVYRIGCNAYDFWNGYSVVQIGYPIYGWPTGVCWGSNADWIYSLCAKPCASSCDAGTYLNSCQCLTCPAGSYCAGDISLPEYCSIGSYATISQSICSSCSAGLYQNSIGQTSCLDCFVGSYQSDTGQSTCLSCSSGTFSSATGLSYCSNCESGKYQASTGQSVCASCSLPCLTTQYSDPNCTTTTNRVCNSCPVDKYCNGVNAYSCGSCLNSQYVSSTCITSPVVCSPCPQSFYCNGINATICSSICTSGTFELTACTSTTNRACSSCTNKPSNSYYTGVGTTSTNCPWTCNDGAILSGSVCILCTPGSFCFGGNTYSCMANSTSPQGSSSVSSCTCNAGFIGPVIQ